MTTALSAHRMEEALDMMERFYADVGIAFDRERARRALEALPGFGGWWFLEAEGRTIGYFVLTIGFSLEFGGRFALLDEFFVEAEWRGKGVGANAMRQIIDQARTMEVSAIHLEADSDVQEFYKRHGFALRGRDMMTLWL